MASDGAGVPKSKPLADETLDSITPPHVTGFSGGEADHLPVLVSSDMASDGGGVPKSADETLDSIAPPHVDDFSGGEADHLPVLVSSEMASDGDGIPKLADETLDSITPPYVAADGEADHLPVLVSSEMASDGDGVPKLADETLDGIAPPDVADFSGGEADPVSGVVGHESGDESMTDADEGENRRKRQLPSGEDDVVDGEIANLDVDPFGGKLNCSLCSQLLERPVLTPCEHNFCLNCFEKWIDRGNTSCAKCRSPIPDKMASNPRVNTFLVPFIRTAKSFPLMNNQDGLEHAIKSKRAKKTATSMMYVTTPSDHFGPIPAENDPIRNLGVLVGESWEDRAECRQWGAHIPHIVDIAGKSDYGAQSVALSGRFKDDVDNGEWFLFTGSGKGFEDQKFEGVNEALRVSCKFGYPVRVVRSYRQKRSAYAPEKGVRYDGVYRIERCWRIARMNDSFKVCRYLFVRCDNEPAPWNSDEHGDHPRPLPTFEELNEPTDVFERTESPAWDFDEGEGLWKWMKPPPESQKLGHDSDEDSGDEWEEDLVEDESIQERFALECLALYVAFRLSVSSSTVYRD
ncbi:hypothetical protein CARUB_v10000573mg [Capsella rubella]|uniref:RING-type E3 ubiquitin transferase n=1 Tax=Capsella rubella TaxID=81985 RepID=R0H650_9BRAS|nr:E3 ubiquitin-protein ligase ORTHRUS-LIKE 1 [Capsella rubella]EOA20270.1 hypothetical protein CARUB_v10000573mg [Capsella rubella]